MVPKGSGSKPTLDCPGSFLLPGEAETRRGLGSKLPKKKPRGRLSSWLVHGEDEKGRSAGSETSQSFVFLLVPKGSANSAELDEGVIVAETLFRTTIETGAGRCAGIRNFARFARFIFPHCPEGLARLCRVKRRGESILRLCGTPTKFRTTDS